MPNPIVEPLLQGVDSDAASKLVQITATPEGVAVVTLNRPAKGNAFDPALTAALAEAFETLQGAEGVRAVFLRGAGGTFSQGADVEWMGEAADQTESDNRADAMATANMLKALWDIPAVTCALVEGEAFGAGAGLVAACDMAVATAGARFAFAEVRHGLIPAVISPYVVAAVGLRAARGLFATGRTLSAGEAERLGLVHAVAEDATGLAAAAERLCDEILASAPAAASEAKRLADKVAGRPLDRGLVEETARLLAAQRETEEAREGVAALIEARPPAWATRG